MEGQDPVRARRRHPQLAADADRLLGVPAEELGGVGDLALASVSDLPISSAMRARALAARVIISSNALRSTSARSRGGRPAQSGQRARRPLDRRVHVVDPGAATAQITSPVDGVEHRGPADPARHSPPMNSSVGVPAGSACDMTADLSRRLSTRDQLATRVSTVSCEVSVGFRPSGVLKWKGPGIGVMLVLVGESGSDRQLGSCTE